MGNSKARARRCCILQSLRVIVEPRQHEHHWKVVKQGSHEKIVVVHGANHRLANLIDFVRSVQFVSSALSSVKEGRDAEYAQTCLAAYQDVAKKYALPSVADTLGNGKQALKNPLLYHLRQILAEEWHQLNSLVKQGKGLDDPVVKNRTDVAMQTALVLAKLVLTHERSFYSPPYKELTKMDQDKYAFWIMYTISNFYGWLRSCSPADSLDVSWQRTYEEICSLGQDNGIKFGDELHIDQRNFMPNEAYLTEQLMVKKL